LTALVTASIPPNRLQQLDFCAIIGSSRQNDTSKLQSKLERIKSRENKAKIYANLKKMNSALPPVIRLPQVLQLTGFSERTIYRWMENDKQFPKQIKLSKTMVVWNSVEVLDWINRNLTGKN